MCLCIRPWKFECDMMPLVSLKVLTGRAYANLVAAVVHKNIRSFWVCDNNPLPSSTYTISSSSQLLFLVHYYYFPVTFMPTFLLCIFFVGAEHVWVPVLYLCTQTSVLNLA